MLLDPKTIPVDYKAASDRQKILQAEYSNHTIVIYRSARLGGQFFLSRQRPSSEGAGRSKLEPLKSIPIGYAIYAVAPKVLVDDESEAPDEIILSQAVTDLCEKGGHQGEPVITGPHVVPTS